MSRFVDFLILVTLCLYLVNLTIEDGSSASLLVPQSSIQTPAAAEIGRDENLSPAINLINLLPAATDVHSKAIDKDYFFRSLMITARKSRDIRSTDAGIYAVDGNIADAQVWKVPDDVSYKNDRDLAATGEIEQLQDNLRKNNAIDFGMLQEHRSAPWAFVAADFRWIRQSEDSSTNPALFIARQTF